jgi:hypothetical protein
VEAIEFVSTPRDLLSRELHQSSKPASDYFPEVANITAS